MPAARTAEARSARAKVAPRGEGAPAKVRWAEVCQEAAQAVAKVVETGAAAGKVVVGKGRGEKLVWLAVAGKVALSTWIRHQGGQSDA